ncbi:histidine kinase [Paenibacillus sp.]|uniref:sensor histidine kinase n=1 Tax=Paenibacillus sp. TaxID=58172 RepID=UPI0028127FDD|nr:histidine kinase [Paenibacillus sp.]
MTPISAARRLVASAANLKLRGKLFVVFLFASILPLLFFVYYSHATLRDELTNQQYANTAATISQINSNLESKLDAYGKISTTLYLDDTLRAYLSQDYSGDTSRFVDAYGYFNNTINNVLTTNPDIHALTLYVTNQTIPLDHIYIRRLDETFMRSPEYEAVKNTYGNIRFLSKRPRPDAPATLTLTRLLNSDSLNFPYGVLTMDILESDIYSLMAKESDDKSIFVVDRGGAILSAKDKSMLGARLDSFVEDGFQDGREGKYDGTYDGEKVFVVYRTTSYGWKTVVLIPYRNFIENAHDATRRILLFAIGSILLATLLIYVTARLITKRVELLLRMIRKVEREEFDVRVDALGRDEIGQLGIAFRSMANRLDNLITEVYKKEIDKKEAEMNVLQAQINPHFLYNTLASISSLALRNADPRMNRMVSDLAKFYRISLNKGKNVISVSEELTLTKYYVAIQRIRFEGLLRMHYDIDESVHPFPIPKLTLQPFVENCINHAIWDDRRGINIIIRARREGGDIALMVIDDGAGFRQTTNASDADASETGRVASGYGIANVDKRMKLMYGPSYGVTLFSRPGIGTSVRIRIPG